MADEDDAGHPAGPGSYENRTCRVASCLSPADGNDGVFDEAVTVVDVKRERDLLTAMAQHVKLRIDTELAI